MTRKRIPALQTLHDVRGNRHRRTAGIHGRGRGGGLYHAAGRRRRVRLRLYGERHDALRHRKGVAGRYIGAKNQTGLRSTVHHLFYWGLGLSFLFTLLYSVGGKSFLGLLTNDISVIAASDSYFYWALIIPLAGFSAFLWDGIFIGAFVFGLNNCI